MLIVWEMQRYEKKLDNAVCQWLKMWVADNKIGLQLRMLLKLNLYFIKYNLNLIKYNLCFIKYKFNFKDAHG